MKPEHYGISAIVLTIILGGGGVGINLNSNKDVAAKLETFNITMTKYEGALQATNVDKARLEAMIVKQGDLVERLRDEISTVKEELKVLQSEVRRNK